MVTKIKIQRLLIALILLVAALSVSSPVYAGGWVVITLDRLPANVVAGLPYALGFAARQHGQTPWKVDEILIEAKQPQTGQTVTFTAKPDQQPGHYRADLRFPQPGHWEWGIRSGLFPPLQPMPALEVASSAAASRGSTGSAGSGAPVTGITVAGALSLPNLSTILLGASALLAFTAGLVLIVRSRGKKLPRLAGGGLLGLCGLLVLIFITSANAQARRLQSIPSTGGDQEVGQQLFLAKGCVVCHVNTRAMDMPEEYSVNAGPNLSAYHNDPAYLRQFLANPKAVRPEMDFPMPNLGLSSTEIDALVNFINSNPSK